MHTCSASRQAGARWHTLPWRGRGGRRPGREHISSARPPRTSVSPAAGHVTAAHNTSVRSARIRSAASIGGRPPLCEAEQGGDVHHNDVQREPPPRAGARPPPPPRCCGRRPPPPPAPAARGVPLRRTRLLPEAWRCAERSAHRCAPPPARCRASSKYPVGRLRVPAGSGTSAHLPQTYGGDACCPNRRVGLCPRPRIVGRAR